MKKRLTIILASLLLAAVMVGGSVMVAFAYQDPGGQPDVVGEYSFSGRMFLFDLNRDYVVDGEGQRIVSRSGTLTISAQTDDALTGNLLLENVEDTTGIALTGYVADPGRFCRIVMYGVPPAVPDGDNFVVQVTAYAYYDETTGDAYRLRGIVIDGIDLNDSANVYTFNGYAGRAAWTEYVP